MKVLKLDFKNNQNILIPGIKQWLQAHILKTLHKQVIYNKNIENILWEYSDEIWRRCGDTSTDYNYYSKRILFNTAYATT